MATKCVNLIKACRIRLVRLDACGKPVVGPKSVITASGFVSVAAAADIEEGEEFLQKNACGELCINEKDCSILKRYNVTVQWCLFDPDAVEMVTGQRLLLDAGGNAKGVAIGESLQCDGGWSLELWQKIAGGECSVDGDPEWMYWAWPFITGATLGDLTFENGAFLFETVGYTKKIAGDDQWGADNVGPFGVLPATAALEIGDHVANFVTDVQPPAAVCGAVALAPAP